MVQYGGGWEATFWLFIPVGIIGALAAWATKIALFKIKKKFFSFAEANSLLKSQRGLWPSKHKYSWGEK